MKDNFWSAVRQHLLSAALTAGETGLSDEERRETIVSDLSRLLAAIDLDKKTPNAQVEDMIAMIGVGKKPIPAQTLCGTCPYRTKGGQ